MTINTQTVHELPVLIMPTMQELLQMKKITSWIVIFIRQQHPS